eukprot:Gregarina_sp_Poly_1__2970@NODE_1832_length_3252_cov_230_314600_g1190_i0_p2_GENE_NODE_1832_length_3252_cov_230_314600_g1190_i0NODE_1832_length_3252_cov_230_314600_g1190_i0_p2_ORF_typecomplete_len304_score46_91Amidinotransf/PF02274_17/7_3e14_NODE_1832_length_3252_cov_230_314600_g1190_i014442355
MPPVFSVASETTALRRLLTKRPQEAWQTQYLIDANWEKCAFKTAPEFNAAAEEHFRFIRFLQAQGVTANYHEDEWIIALESIGVRDACLVTPVGLIQGLLTSSDRVAEPESVASYLEQLGGDILGRISGPGEFCASDAIWLSSNLLAIAVSPRTNLHAIQQIRDIFAERKGLQQIKILQLELTASSPDEERVVRTALVNALSPIKESAAIIARHKFTPESIKVLEEAGIQLEDVSPQEYQAFGASVLVVNPHAACTAKAEALERIQSEILELKYKYTVYPMKYDMLSSARVGVAGLVLPTKRD